MAKTIVQKDSIITTGANAFVVSIGDTYIVEQSIIVAAGDGHAGILMVEDAHLVLKGIASGFLGIEDLIGGQDIKIEKTGTATGNPTGVFLKNHSFLNNEGHVAGNSAGVVIGGFDSDITNSGTIQANPRDGGAAIYMGVNAGGTHTLINSGLLTNSGGDGMAIDVDQFLTSVELVTNSGKILGGIALGRGNDSLDTTLGTVQGKIDLGDGNDTAKGSAGADHIYGGVGNDVLVGNGGADRIEGWVGRDFMTGNSGADKFIFRFATNTGKTTATADIISDFKHSQADKVDLSGMDANSIAANNQAFHFLGTGGFTHHAGEIRYNVSGGNAIVSGDVNGDAVIDFVIQLNGVSSLTAGDFVL